MNIVVCVKYVPDAQADRGFEPDRTTDRAGVDGLLSELDEVLLDARSKGGQGGGNRVIHNDRVPGEREHLPDAVAHQSGPDDPDACLVSHRP